MQEAIDGFYAMPLWAQIGVAFFVFTFIVMLVEPKVRKRRFRRQFDDIVRALGREPSRGGDWPFTATVNIAGRDFELRYDFRQRSRGTTYRGPTGHLLITVTRLAGTRWPLHQVDIRRVDGLLARLASRKRKTGDPSFDERFLVVEDGSPVREGWLDTEMRAAITRFFAETGPPGLVWIHEGELQFTIEHPWKGVDGPVVRALLERQAALAAALQRTASPPRQ